MQQSQDDPEVRLIEAARIVAAAEHQLWAQMLDHAEQLEAEYSTTPEYFLRQSQLRSIALEIGVAMQMSEGQVHRILSAAERLRDQAPAVWSAFADGVIDAKRAVLISDAVGRLEREASIAKLNLKAVAYAADHTSIELKAWLKRFVARTESDLFNQRSEHERAERRVVVDHTDPSTGSGQATAMAWLSAYLPSHVAAAIDKRLTKEANAMVGDTRTLAQKRADLLACWLTTNEHGDAALNADIAVVLDAATLAGADASQQCPRTGHSSCPPPGSSTRRTTRSGTPCSPTRAATPSNTATTAASPPTPSRRPPPSPSESVRHRPSTATPTTASRIPTDPPTAPTSGRCANDITR